MAEAMILGPAIGGGDGNLEAEVMAPTTNRDVR